MQASVTGNMAATDTAIWNTEDHNCACFLFVLERSQPIREGATYVTAYKLQWH